PHAQPAATALQTSSRRETRSAPRSTRRPPLALPDIEPTDDATRRLTRPLNHDVAALLLLCEPDSAPRRTAGRDQSECATGRLIIGGRPADDARSSTSIPSGGPVTRTGFAYSLPGHRCGPGAAFLFLATRAEFVEPGDLLDARAAGRTHTLEGRERYPAL